MKYQHIKLTALSKLHEHRYKSGVSGKYIQLNANYGIKLFLVSHEADQELACLQHLKRKQFPFCPKVYGKVELFEPVTASKYTGIVMEHIAGTHEASSTTPADLHDALRKAGIEHWDLHQNNIIVRDSDKQAIAIDYAYAQILEG